MKMPTKNQALGRMVEKRVFDLLTEYESAMKQAKTDLESLLGERIDYRHKNTDFWLERGDLMVDPREKYSLHLVRVPIAGGRESVRKAIKAHEKAVIAWNKERERLWKIRDQVVDQIVLSDSYEQAVKMIEKIK